MARHKLMTKEILDRLPALYAQDGHKDPIVHVKFFFPASAATWFITEGSKEDDDMRLYGMCLLNDPRDAEWGYVMLSELETLEVRHIHIERDQHFTPTPYSKVREDFKRTHGVELPAKG
jgi:hypothetical protein